MNEQKYCDACWQLEPLFFIKKFPTAVDFFFFLRDFIFKKTLFEKTSILELLTSRLVNSFLFSLQYEDVSALMLKSGRDILSRPEEPAPPPPPIRGSPDCALASDAIKKKHLCFFFF